MMADRLTEEKRAVAYGWAEEVRDNPEVGGRFAIPFAARLILELHEENARLREAGNHDVADLIAARDAAFEQRDALEERATVLEGALWTAYDALIRCRERFEIEEEIIAPRSAVRNAIEVIAAALAIPGDGRG